MKYILLTILIFFAWGCKRDSMPDGNIMPPTLDFVLLDKQGNNLLLSTTTPIKVSSTSSRGQVFYLGSECNEGCTMVRATHSNSRGTPKYDFYYSSLGASLASSDGSKTWYIELGGKTDTLYYDMQQTRPNDPLDKFETKAVIFNGQAALQEDPAQPPLYVFRRKH